MLRLLTAGWWCLGVVVITTIMHCTAASHCLHIGACPAPCVCSAHAPSPHVHTHFDIDCSGAGLTSFPAVLPLCTDPTVPMSYHLNFSHNDLSLGTRNSSGSGGQYAYLANTVELDLSVNKLEGLSTLLQLDLSKVKTLLLHGNLFTSLASAELGNLSSRLPALETLTLHDNPWICDCELEPLRSWLRLQCNDTACTHSILDINRVVCYRSKPSVPVVSADFRCDQTKDEGGQSESLPGYVPAIIAIVLVYLLVCTFIAVCIVLRNRHKVTVNEDDLQLKA